MPSPPVVPESTPLSPPPEAVGEPGIETAISVGHWVDCDPEEIKCRIHRTGDAPGDAAGWPVTVDGPCRELRTGSTGLAYVACSPRGGATIHVLDLDGRPVSGWPVRVDGAVSRVAWNDFSIGCGIDRSAIDLGSDGSVYVAISEGSAARLHVFNPDGSLRAGWPQRIPGDAPGPDGSGGDGCRGFAVADDDGVVAWGYEDVETDIELRAGRTEFTSWTADGAVRPGWPRGSKGAASGPVLDVDGGITYVSASGRVWSHDDAGGVRPGWPYALSHPAPPFAAPDGRVAIVQKVEQATDKLVILARDGRPITGRSIRLPADIETRCLFGDTPCAGDVAPVFATDGTLYLPLAWSTTEHVIPDTTNMGGALAAFDPSGTIVDGWPIDLDPRVHILGLSVGCRRPAGGSRRGLRARLLRRRSDRPDDPDLRS